MKTSDRSQHRAREANAREERLALRRILQRVGLRLHDARRLGEALRRLRRSRRGEDLRVGEQNLLAAHSRNRAAALLELRDRARAQLDRVVDAALRERDASSQQTPARSRCAPSRRSSIAASVSSASRSAAGEPSARSNSPQ